MCLARGTPIERIEEWLEGTDEPYKQCETEEDGPRALRVWLGLQNTGETRADFRWLMDDATHWTELPGTIEEGSTWDDGSLKCTGAQWPCWEKEFKNFTDKNYRCVTVDAEGTWKQRECDSPKTTANYVCEFDPPATDRSCIQHVIQRPDYTAPNVKPCWSVMDNNATEEPFDLELNATAAEAECVRLGGHLATIRNEEENWLMRRLLDEASAARGVYKNRAWIGLYDTTSRSDENPAEPRSSGDRDWTWFSGDSSTFRNWVPGEPNDKEDKEGPPGSSSYNSELHAIGENYVEYKTEYAGWNDEEGSEIQVFVCEFYDERSCDSHTIDNLDPPFDVTFPPMRTMFLSRSSFLSPGKFKGMTDSPGVVALDMTDPFFGQFDFEIQLDEVELRSKAGKLRGTVGVEHTIDTYLGLSNFRPTGTHILDTFSVQTALHLEKTSFFTVSTHGTNEYTFLEYVNMRLVEILQQDVDFSGESESNVTSVRTDRADNVNYVQVTFTMGDKYNVNTENIADVYNNGLIPLNSVRAGLGTFLDSTSMYQTCTRYQDSEPNVGLSGAGKPINKTVFNQALDQPCAPASSMCVSPSDVPDHFVVFNIPLGSEVFDNQASNDLSNNIFVDFVINAVDTEARAKALAGNAQNPNQGAAPWQMKTTLSASIPIVAGGVNTFCDGVTAKTDLKDVADVDIIVGTANSDAELTRLRILSNLASTQLETVESAEINTDSIESGLLTMVLKGNVSYFTGAGNTNTGGYALELDDLITIHLMEDGEATTTNSKEAALLEMLDDLPADNSDTNGLLTEGYLLNGAFSFDVDRQLGIAKLNPTPALVDICPYNPTRPAAGYPLETCVTRRDVMRRQYPKRLGAAQPTAMEILQPNVWAAIKADTALFEDFSTGTTEQDAIAALEAQESGSCVCVDDQNCCEAAFMQGILGENGFSRGLAVNFVKAIHQRYSLNGRWTRAYWINPGYEWTPTQTAGKSIFQVSQKVYLFALITLDENWATSRRSFQRRMLLQADTDPTDPTKNSGSGVSSASVSYQVTPRSMMANAYDVPKDHVVLLNLEVMLTKEEACMTGAERQSHFTDVLEEALASTAVKFYTVQVVAMNVDLGSVECGGARRRSLRKLLNSFTDATAELQALVVFHDDVKPAVNFKKLSEVSGITSVKFDDRTPGLDDPDLHTKDSHQPKKVDAGGSSSVNAALIGGVVGGVVGVVAIAVGVVMFMRSRKDAAALVAEPVTTINVDELKAQLSRDMM
jgi:hypothetical protein